MQESSNNYNCPCGSTIKRSSLTIHLRSKKHTIFLMKEPNQSREPEKQISHETDTEITTDNGTFIFECPWCENIIQVPISQLGCSMFRHGIYKHNHEPINQRASKEACDMLVSKDLIFGCSKPFSIYEPSKGMWKARRCDYI